MKNLYDLIIIGAGPGGLSAAIYAGRAKLRTLMLTDETALGQISITEEVVNYPGIISTSGPQLIHTMKKQASNFGVEAVNGRVERVDFTDTIKKVYTKDGAEHKAIAVLIATGARPRTLDFPGEKEFTGRGIGFCATCDGAFFAGKDIFVVGGGLAAAEEAVFLTRFGRMVYMIVREDDLTVPVAIAENTKSNPKIKLFYNSEVKRVTGDKTIKSIEIMDNKSGETWTHNADEGDTFGVFIFVGYQPISEIFRGAIGLDDGGYILTNDNMLTSVKGVYAAGDVRPKPLRQLVTAISDGAVAVTSLQNYVEQVKRAQNLVVQSIEEPVGDTTTSEEHGFDNDIVAGLKPILERMEQGVILEVTASNSNAQLTKELLDFAKNFADLSDKIEIIELADTGEELLPRLSLKKADGSSGRIHYHGVPSGHEFNSFVLGVYNVSGPGQTVEERDKQRINGLKPSKIYVGATLSCTMCPDVVQASQIVAMINEGIETHMVDIGHFPEFRDKHDIMSVPALVVNDKVSFGRKDLSAVIEQLQ